MEKKSFLDLPAPPNYVAGIGRGATGFTTRSDIGPAKLDFDGNDDEDDGANVDNNAELGLLNIRAQDQEDEEADRIYEMIEERLRNRHKKRKIDTNDASNTEANKDKGDQNTMENISNQFADLKKGLSTISEDQWLNLPEAGDMTRRNKRERELARQQRRTYNINDSILSSLRDQQAIDMQVSANGDEVAIANGLEENDIDTNFEFISSARGKILSSKLDGNQNDSSNHPLSAINANDYLTSLQAIDEKNQSFSKITGDLAKSRAIFKSLRNTEPYNPINWIMSARIELLARKPDLAKKLIEDGCRKCPKDEGIWLESISINNSNVIYCKKLTAEALTFNLKSEKLWLKAIDLEPDIFAKKQIVRKALTNLSDSINLWKLAIQLEDNAEESKKLLLAAIEIIPSAIELWLSLIELETDTKQCKKVLNNARKSLPKSHEIWIEAGKLEEKTVNDANKVAKLMKKGVQEVTKNGSTLTRKEWLNEAKRCEDTGFPSTAVAIVNSTLLLGLEDKDQVDKIITWQEDADRFIKSNNIEVATAIYNYIVSEYPQEIPVWRYFFDFLKRYSSTEILYQSFEQSITANPSFEEFWLRFAKEKWMNGDVDGARNILRKAFKKNSQSVDIWLAAIKLETSNKFYEKASELLAKARTKLKDPRMWYKSVTLERQLGHNDAALDLVAEGLTQFENTDKLHMQKGQILEDLNKFEEAREAYATGVRICENSVNLWILLAHNLMSSKLTIKARSALDKAIIKNPDSDKLWIAKIELERSLKNYQEVRNLVNQAYQKFRNSPLIWYEKLKVVGKRSEMKKNFVEAMKETNSDPLILLAVGANFYIESKYDKAKIWFERSIGADKDFGDAWCWLYVFYKKKNQSEELLQLVKEFKIAEPKHGKVWPSVAKDIKNFEKTTEELLDIASEKLLE